MSLAIRRIASGGQIGRKPNAVSGMERRNIGYGLGGVLIPEEAAVIREMADRFLAGQSIRQIAVWLNRDGGPIPPSKGKSRLNIWHASTVRSILCSARISGQRAYDPDAPRGGEKPGGRAIMGPGNWEAIITPEETERIRAVFANPDRRVGRSAKSLLAGIISCGKCGNTLVTGGWRSGQTAPSKQHFYRCLPLPGRPERGGLSASAAGVEAVVTEAIIRRLAATTLPDESPGDDGGVSRAMEQITAARQRMEDMARDYGAGILTRAELHAAKTAAGHTIIEAERLLGRTSKSAALKGIPIGDEPALRAAWEEQWSIPQKRAIIAALVDTLIIKPLPRGGARFRPNGSRSLSKPEQRTRRTAQQRNFCAVLRSLLRSGAGACEHAELRQRDRVGDRERHPRPLTGLPRERVRIESRRQLPGSLRPPLLRTRRLCRHCFAAGCGVGDGVHT